MAAKNGTITLASGPFRKTMSIYASDSAGVACTIASDGKADANSPAFYLTPVAMWIHDLVLEGAPVVTTLILKINDIPTAVILIANHLASIQSRPSLGLVLPAGGKLSIFQAT